MVNRLRRYDRIGMCVLCRWVYLCSECPWKETSTTELVLVLLMAVGENSGLTETPEKELPSLMVGPLQTFLDGPLHGSVTFIQYQVLILDGRTQDSGPQLPGWTKSNDCRSPPWWESPPEGAFPELSSRADSDVKAVA